MRFGLGARRLVAVLPACALIGLAAGGAGPAWQRHAPMPQARSEVAAAAAGDEIVVAGGYVRSGANSARADAYVIAADRWRRLPDLRLPSTTRRPRAWMGACT